MDFNSLRPDREPHRERQFILPPYFPTLHRVSSVGSTGSIESEDPLALPQPQNSNTPRTNASHPRPSSEARRDIAKPKLAVVLTTSPNHKEAYSAVDTTQKPIASDLSSKWRNQQPQSGPSSGTESSAPRPRGRPKGSTKTNLGPRTDSSTAAGPRQARQVKPRPSPSASVPAKRRGRPPRPPSPPPRQIYASLEVPFVAFICEWKDCPAELHNLDTLRKHVYRVHGAKDEGLCCRWGRCGAITPGRLFDTKGALWEHIEAAHLVPFAWHVGDGPSNEGAREQEEVPDYLKDRDGKQVTPSIRGQKEEDAMTRKMNRRKLRELLRRRDENLPSEESDEAMDGDT